MENLYLIAGLGNPGREYARTRHNAGFLLVERLAERWHANWTEERKFSARLAKVDREERRLILCQPLTYMNASGEALGTLSEFYKIPANRVLVAVDDADLGFGEIRLRPRGSSGGHHGLESIEQHLATQDYARLRIGIGRTQSGVREITNYVLGQFRPEEHELLNKVLERAADQVECWLAEGIEKAMNRFNGAVNNSETKESK